MDCQRWPALSRRSRRRRLGRPPERGPQSSLEEFSVGSAHLDDVDAIQGEGVAYRVVHQVSRARGAVTLRVEGYDGPPTRKHRKSDGGLLTWLIARVFSLASENMSQSEGKNGR